MKQGKFQRAGIGFTLQTLALALGLMTSAAAGVLYDNDNGRTGGIFNPGVEFGDEVLLSSATPSATSPVSINGAYVVVAPNGYAGGASVTLRIRKLNGPPDPKDPAKRPGPGDVLGSGSASVPAITRTTRIYVGLSATLDAPSFVVTAEFSGLSSTTSLGVMVANGASGGSSSSAELWVLGAAGWKVQDLSPSPSNLGFILLGSGGSDALRAGGGAAASTASSVNYRENQGVVPLAKGSLVSFSGTQTLTVSVTNPSGDKLTSGSSVSDANGGMTFSGTEGSLRDFLENLQYENISENPRAGAHVINFAVGGLSSVVTVNVTAVNDAPVVALDIAGGAQTTYTVNQFKTGETPIIVPFTYSDPEGTALLTLRPLSDVEAVIKTTDCEIIETAVDATGKGTGKLKINQANVPTGTAFPAGLRVAIIATDRGNQQGNAIVLVKVNSKNAPPAFVIPGNESAKVWTVIEDGVLEIPFTLSDDAPEGLTIEKTSSQPNVISADGVVLKTRTTGLSPYLEIKPQPDQNGEATLTLVAKDKDGGTTPQVLKVLVTPVNDAPVITAMTLGFTGTEFQPKSDTETPEESIVVKIPFDVSDVDVGDVVTLAVELDDASKNLLSEVQIVPGTKLIRLLPRPFRSGGPGKITLVATDKSGLKAQKEFTLTVPDLNNPPVFAEVTTSKTVREVLFKVIDDKPVVAANLSAVSDKLTLIPNDFEFTQRGDLWVMTYKILGSATGGEVHVNLSYKDEGGLFVVAVISFTVDKVEIPPALELISEVQVNEDEQLQVGLGVDDLVTPADQLKVTVDFTGVSQTGGPLIITPSGIKVDNVPGSPKERLITLTLVPGAFGQGQATVTVTANSGLFTTKTLVLKVLAVNDPPVVDKGIPDQSVDNNVAFTFQIPVNAFKDPDLLDVLSYSAELAAGGPLPQPLFGFTRQGQLTFNASQQIVDATFYSIKVTATDKDGEEAFANFELTVKDTGLNLTRADLASKSVAFYELMVGRPAATAVAPYGDLTSLAADVRTSISKAFGLGLFGSGASFLPNSNASREDSAVILARLYRAIFGSDAPVVSTPFTDLSGIAGAGDIARVVGLGLLAGVNPTSFSPASSMKTGDFDAALDRLKSVLPPPNRGPVSTRAIGDQLATVGVAFSLQTSDSFADLDTGDVLKFSARQAGGGALPSWLSFSGGQFGGTPGSADIKVLTIEVVASDRFAVEAVNSFTLRVTPPPNHPPVVSTRIGSQSGQAGTALSFSFGEGTFTDPDAGDILTYSAGLASGDPLPAWLSFVASTRTFSGTPPAAGDVPIRVIATDVAGASVFDLVNLNVSPKPPNTLPTVSFVSDSYVIKEDAGSGKIQFKVNDAETPVKDLTFAVKMTGDLVAGVNFVTFTGADFLNVVKTAAAGTTIYELSIAVKNDGVITSKDTGTIELKVTDADGGVASAKTKLTVSDVSGTANQRLVNLYYTVLFDRQADAAGRDFFVAQLANNTASPTVVATTLLNSTEGRSRFVSQCYNEILGRSPDSTSVVQNFVNQIAAGATRQQVMAQFFGSSEFFSNYATVNGTPNAQQYVRLLYHHILRRAGDSIGVKNFTDLINGGSQTRTQVAQTFLTSDEYYSNVLLPAFYSTYLRRSADSGGQAFFLNQLKAGTRVESVLASFLGSAEFIAGMGSFAIPGVSAFTTHYLPDANSKGLIITTLVHPWAVFTHGDFVTPDPLSSIFTPVGAIDAAVSKRGVTMILTYGLNSTFTQGATVNIDYSASVAVAPRTGGTNPSGTVGIGFSQRNIVTLLQGTVVTGGLTPLTISPIGAQVTEEGKATTVSVQVNGGTGLSVTATSGNLTVLPPSGIAVTGSGANWSLTLTPAAGQAQDVVVTVTAVDAAKRSVTQTFTLSILPAAPVIASSPTDKIIVGGGSVTFSVGATGSNLRYQWQRFDFGLAQFADISGATLSTYSTSLAETLRVVVQNLGGRKVTDSVKSVLATPPSARVLPAEGLTIEEGADAAFTASSILSSFPPVTVEWRRNGEIVKTGAGTLQLSTDGLTLVAKAPTEGGTYSVRVTDQYSSADSNGALLTVRKKLAIKTQPVALEKALGATATFTVEMQGDGPFRYQWRKNGANISGATDKILTINPVGVTDAGRYSVVIIKDGANAFTSNDAELKLSLPDLPFTDRFADRGLLAGNSGLGDASNSSAESASEADEPMPRVETGGVSRILTVYNTVWAKWVAPANGVLSLSTEGSSFDTVLNTYSGQTTVNEGITLANLKTVAQDDDSGASHTSKLSFSVVKGTEYAIRVGLASGDPGVIVFGWQFLPTEAPTPTVDKVLIGIPSNAANLTTAELSFDVTANGAPSLYRLIALKGTKEEVLVAGSTASFVLARSPVKWLGRYQVEAVSSDGTSQARGVAFKIYIDGAELRLEGYPLNSPGTKYSVPVDQTPSVRVARLSLGAKGQSVNALNVTALQSPRDSRIISTDGETTDSGEPNHGGVIGGASVWFSLLAPASGSITATTEGQTDFDTVLAVYTGTTNAFGTLDYPTLKLVASDNNGGTNGLTSRVSFQAEKGVEYFLAVDGVNGASGVLQFTVSLDVAPTLSSIPDQAIAQNSVGNPVAFRVEDSVAGSSGLRVSGSSSNNSLIDSSKFLFGGDATDRTVIISPEPGKSGVADVTLTVSDGVFVVSSKFKVTVTPVNQPPVADDLNLATAEDTAKSLILSGKDPEGKPITFKILTQPALGKITGQVPNLTYTPNLDAQGVDRFTYAVNDGALDSAPGSITVVVLSLNDAPLIAPLANVKAESGIPQAPIELRLSDVDSPLDSLSVSVRSDNQAVLPDGNLGVKGSGGVRSLILVPSSDTPGLAVVTVTVSDVEGGSSSAQFTVDVLGAPPSFLIQPKGAEVVEGVPFSMLAQAGGTGPFSYSWLRDGKLLAGATTQVLNFEKLKLTDAGKYSLVVKNPVGTATSEVVELKVRLKSSYPTKLSGAIALEGFALSFTSAPGGYRIQSSSDLAAWKTILSTTLVEGAIEFTDTEAPDHELRFYRVIEGTGD